MTAKDAGAPCPPVDEKNEDNVLAHEADADFSAEETNPKEVPTA